MGAWPPAQQSEGPMMPGRIELQKGERWELAELAANSL